MRRKSDWLVKNVFRQNAGETKRDIGEKRTDLESPRVGYNVF